jgi:hypothetical protein
LYWIAVINKYFDMGCVTFWSSCIYMYNCFHHYKQSKWSILTRGPRQLKPSNLTPVLQYGSGSSWLHGQNIRCQHTTVSLNTQFYFPLSSNLVNKFYKSRNTFVSDSSVFKPVKFYLNLLIYLFSIFPLFTFGIERSAVGFSMWDIENKQFPFKVSAGWVQDFKTKHNIRQKHVTK